MRYRHWNGAAAWRGQGKRKGWFPEESDAVDDVVDRKDSELHAQEHHRAMYRIRRRSQSLDRAADHPIVEFDRLFNVPFEQRLRQIGFVQAKMVRGDVGQIGSASLTRSEGSEGGGGCLIWNAFAVPSALVSDKAGGDQASKARSSCRRAATPPTAVVVVREARISERC